jgi:hypothetical protein
MPLQQFFDAIISRGRGDGRKSPVRGGLPPELIENRANDAIIRSLYLLDYVDSPPLRRNVQRALNRGENYHQLRRAVSYANFGKLRFKSEDDQVLWSEYSRLITNCIIYYNATILSRLLAHKEAAGDREGTAMLKQVSPVAWQHINFYGRRGAWAWWLPSAIPPVSS